jgi:hypothetical protein
LGLKPWEFWELSWPDYNRICAGFYHRQELEWERTRWLGALIFNANSKSQKSPAELVPLNLDKARQANRPKVNIQELRAIMEAEQKLLDQKNGLK